MIDLFDPGDVSFGGYRQTDTRLTYNAAFLDEVDVEPDAGVSGLDALTRKVEWSGDYLNDARFGHTPERDGSSAAAGSVRDRRPVLRARRGDRRRSRSTPTARMRSTSRMRRSSPAWPTRPRSRSPMSSLIGELERSREENAQRADAERTLREIAARVSSILDPARSSTGSSPSRPACSDSDGARIDLWDERIGALRWAYSTGDAMSEVPSGAAPAASSPAGRGRPGVPRTAAGHDRGFPGRRPLRHDPRDRGVRAQGRHPGGHRVRRCRARAKSRSASCPSCRASPAPTPIPRSSC